MLWYLIVGVVVVLATMQLGACLLVHYASETLSAVDIDRGE